MPSPSTIPRLDPEHATQAWDLISSRLAEFIEHWESDRDPPRLVDFLPESPPALRYVALVELIKADLSYQWRWGRDPKGLDHYLQQFPELGGPAGVACDLIYEEFHVRKQAGDTVEAAEFLERFPRQAPELQRLLTLESPHLTTALFSGKMTLEIEPGQQLDDFDLINRLGKGAFATVFLARQRSMQRLVALKVSADQGTEPQTLAQLDHPHIVRVYDQRQLADRNLRLLYMQYLPGGTLLEVVAAARSLKPHERTGKLILAVVDRALTDRGESPPTDSITRQKLAGANWPAVVCWIGARLAAALDYAHHRGVLHRDVKPANVLLSADASPKLADFNISFSSELEGVTAAAYFGGSLPYMSPEQLEACNPESGRKPEDLDGRSDVYSLAIVLWELLTGNRPFADDMLDDGWTRTLEEMLQRRREGIPAAERAKLPADCPTGLDEVMHRALAADRDERYASAAHFARQLELCLQPRVQQLLRPRRRIWHQLAQRFPLWMLSLAAFVPNVIASAINISYNVSIGNHDPAVAAAMRDRMLTIVNVVMYSIGIAILCGLAWPVYRQVMNRPVGKNAAVVPPGVRRRSLVMGDAVALVTILLWPITGCVFAAWVHHLSLDSVLDLRRLREFVASHAVNGLMASTVAFFVVTFVSVRFVYPLLLRTDTQDAAEVVPLVRLSRRITWYFFSAVISPLLAVMYLGFAESPPRGAIVIVGLLGVATFGIPYRLARSIQADLATLVATVTPATGAGSLEASTVDSFWTSADR